MPPKLPPRDELRAEDPHEFSLVLGGPLFQLWRRARLAGNSLELMRRRVLSIVLFAWAPLLLLSIAEGQAWGRSVDLPFLHDVELHGRLLVALPLLVLAEVVVHRRMRLVARQFLEHGLIPDAGRPRFDQAVASATRGSLNLAKKLADAITAEGLVALAVTETQVGLTGSGLTPEQRMLSLRYVVDQFAQKGKVEGDGELNVAGQRIAFGTCGARNGRSAFEVRYPTMRGDAW